ncbi:MAG: tRNA(fMet)-specific endonuclease VapC [Amaricoccus sp.]|nr:tRNA(fMet)-specific endonuclease VapC [Amaricoccus sp.]
MLDTNICIFVMKGRGPGLAARFEREAAHLCISSITLAELDYGVEKSEARSRNRGALDAFAARLAVLDFDCAAAAAYGALRAGLERDGRPIGPYDLLIAAHATSRGLAVVTNNRREFGRAPGVHVEDWSV